MAFPQKHVSKLAELCDCIIVPEMNLGQMAHEVEWASAGKTEVIKVNRIDGEPIRPSEILDAIMERV